MAARDLARQFKRLSSGQLKEEHDRVASTIHHNIAKTTAALPANKSKNRYGDPKFAPCTYVRNKAFMYTLEPLIEDSIVEKNLSIKHTFPIALIPISERG